MAHTRAARRQFLAHLRAHATSDMAIRAAIRTWRGTRGQGPDFLDLEPFETALVAAHAVALGSGTGVKQPPPAVIPENPTGLSEFADPPPDLSARLWYADALGRFRAKRVINGEQMQTLLDAMPAAIARRNNVSERQTLHSQAFTMIREGNQQIIKRVAETFDRVIAAQGTGADFLHDMNDVYAAAGISDQQPWYTELVYTNNMNRAYQEGLDATAAELDKDGDLWGYEWVHSGAADPRPAHVALDKWAAPKNDPRWAQIGVPPIGHGCGCQRLPITHREAADRGLKADPPTPTIPRDAGGMPAGYQGGLSAIEGLDTLPGERFARGQYWVPNRPLFNPSWGMESQNPFTRSTSP
jgi:hypothetical protein